MKTVKKISLEKGEIEQTSTISIILKSKSAKLKGGCSNCEGDSGEPEWPPIITNYCESTYIRK